MDVALDGSPAGRAEDERVRSALRFLSSWFSRRGADEHRTVKSKLAGPFSGPAVEELEGELRETARTCARTLTGRVDLVSDFLEPFWVRSTARMLGVPEDQHARLAKVSAALGRVMELPTLDARSARIVETCRTYLRALLTHLLDLEDPPHAARALAGLADHAGEGRPDVAVAALAHLLAAGFHPTVTGAALAWDTMHLEPRPKDELERGALATSDFVSEVLRLRPPFPVLHRWTREPCDCHGVELEAGTYVLVDLRAANRDPEVFARPDELMAGRDQGPLLTFGHGVHRCLGAEMAKRQISVALEALLSERPGIRPEDGLEFRGSGSGHLTVVESAPCRCAAASEA